MEWPSILIEIDTDEFRKTCYIMKKWQIVIGLQFSWNDCEVTPEKSAEYTYVERHLPPTLGATKLIQMEYKRQDAYI